tara:strand:+ start:54 stop:422 length:369 start_codon:yes stop_codon:yes gene_type:complete
MYEVLIKSDFCGAHNLEGYKGRCEELHGHNWKVEARFQKNSLDDIGIAADFKDLKAMLKVVLEKMDHAYLNKLESFKGKNPSAENIAQYIYTELGKSIKTKGLSVKSVSVWESDATCATYYE